MDTDKQAGQHGRRCFLQEPMLFPSFRLVTRVLCGLTVNTNIYVAILHATSLCGVDAYDDREKRSTHRRTTSQSYGPPVLHTYTGGAVLLLLARLVALTIFFLARPRLQYCVPCCSRTHWMPSHNDLGLVWAPQTIGNHDISIYLVKSRRGEEG